MFDEFWMRYPKKREMPLAREAYKHALKIATHDEIMAGLERFITAEPWHGDLHYCIFPERWLKRERWCDEYEEPVDALSASRSQRKVRLEALVNNGFWSGYWGEQPSEQQARAELNAPRLRVVS